MRFARLILFILISCFGQVVLAQEFTCGVTCEPSLSSSTYQHSTVEARTHKRNLRGRSGALTVEVAGGPSSRVLGSESYNYAVPILGLPGRNGLDLGLVLHYSSRVWTFDSNTATLNADRDFPSYGFRLGFGYLEGPLADTGTYTLTEGNGAKRDLSLQSTNIYISLDSSYLELNTSGSTKVLRRKGGTEWHYQQVGTTTIYRPIKILDVTGNFISIAYSAHSNATVEEIDTVTDTLGRVITFNYDANDKVTSITGPAPGGGTKTYASFSWGQITLTYNFASPVTTAGTPTSGTTINVLTGCSYPNGAAYEFVYGDWAIVKEIKAKSANGTVRSKVTYNYPTASTALSDHPTYTEQTVFDGVNTGTWTYSVTKSSGVVTSTSVTDPAGTTTVTNLYTSGWETGLVSSVVIKQGTTTLRTFSTTWARDGSSGQINPRVASSGNGLSSVQFTYTTNGNVSEVRESNFQGLLVRKTQTDYLTTSAYVDRHILDRATQVRIYDGAGSLKAKTVLAYDAGTLTSLSPNPSQWQDPSTSTRANLTSLTRYENAAAGSGAITRNFIYDVAGNLRQADLDCCQQRVWSYTSTTQYAYPETVTSGPSGTQLQTSQTYEFQTGLVLTATDANNKTTDFEYDTMGRLRVVIRSDDVEFLTDYDDNALLPVITNTTPIDATRSIVQVITTDGLGRALKQETKDASSNTHSIVEAQYDTLGRVTQASNPRTSGQSPLWTVTAYDALSRTTSVTPPGSTGSYQYEYTNGGLTVKVTDPAGKQRRTYTDGWAGWFAWMSRAGRTEHLPPAR